MIYKMYSVRDVKGVFDFPFPAYNDDVATRIFQHGIIPSDPIRSACPHDFDLYRVGEFDSNLCKFECESVPVLVVNGEVI